MRLSSGTAWPSRSRMKHSPPASRTRCGRCRLYSRAPRRTQITLKFNNCCIAFAKRGFLAVRKYIHTFCHRSIKYYRRPEVSVRSCTLGAGFGSLVQLRGCGLFGAQRVSGAQTNLNLASVPAFQCFRLAAPWGAARGRVRAARAPAHEIVKNRSIPP